MSATPRQLESLIRISEALAKMRLSGYVTVPDVNEAVRLMKVRQGGGVACGGVACGGVACRGVACGGVACCRVMRQNGQQHDMAWLQRWGV